MRFDKQKPYRVNRYFHGITNFDGFWWLVDSKVWVKDLPSPLTEPVSTYTPCRTLKAFRRHLRNHPEIQGKAVLASRYHGYDVYA